jgi:formylglycine-generating enzyme required for sulfatase activity/predicted ATPase
MKRCVQCNTELPDDARFCLQCGAPQRTAPGAQARVEGDGAIAQQGATAAGAGGAAVGGDVHGDVIVGERPPGPAELRLAYLNHLFETVSALSLSGIDPKAASDYATQGRAQARLNLGAVYTALLTLTPEECEQIDGRATFAPEMRERPGGERRRLSALAQLDRHSRLVLLGDPGSGKSTFVNFVALCLAGEALGTGVANLVRMTEPLPQDDEDRRREEKEPQAQPWSHGALLPVRVVLRDFAARGLPPAGQPATAKHLWRFIAAELESAALADYGKPLVQELLKQGGLLLVDGLDEVPEANRRREQIKQAVEDFAKAFPRCRVLVTSRTYAYQQQAWRLPGFAEAVLAPFDTGQIRRFVDRWYAHIAQLRGLHADDAQGRAELLKRAIFGSDRLRALAERPLLLTLMSSLHAWRGGSLPDRREELYADTVDLLLDWWEQPKVVRDAEGQVTVQQPSLAEWLQVDRSKVRGLLEGLAYQAHKSQPDVVGTADVPEGDLLGGLMHLSQNPEVRNNPALLVSYLSQRAGLLLPRGVGVYTFPHRTFQEYLAACCLTDHDYPEKVAELARADPYRWREVALLAGAKAARGTASAIWSLVDALCYQELSVEAEQAEPDAWGALLAGQALVESADLSQVSGRNQAKVKRVRTHLVRVLEAGQLPAVERVAVGGILAKLGDSRPGVGVRSDGLPDVVWCQVPAGPFTMGSPDDRLSFLDAKETPQRRVDLLAFRVTRYPVTNAQFAAFVRAGGYGVRRYWTGAAQKQVWSEGRVKAWNDDQPRKAPYDFGEPFNLPNHPVVGVTWYEAVAFCLWLTEQLHRRGELGADEEISLPAESQWEKAARGADGRVYPWGNDADPERANYADTGIGTTSAVGCFPGGASPYGVEDSSGNVWEWCRTKFEEGYDGYRDDNDLEGDDPRVLRGGAFNYIQRYVRCAFRNGLYPYDRNYDVGFRLVMVSPSTLDSERSEL